MPNYVAKGQSWKVNVSRAGYMVLNPLTDIGVRMFVTIGISCGQLMVNVLGHGERSQPQDDADHPQRNSNPKSREESY